MKYFILYCAYMLAVLTFAFILHSEKQKDMDYIRANESDPITAIALVETTSDSSITLTVILRYQGKESMRFPIQEHVSISSKSKPISVGDTVNYRTDDYGYTFIWK